MKELKYRCVLILGSTDGPRRVKNKEPGDTEGANDAVYVLCS